MKKIVLSVLLLFGMSIPLLTLHAQILPKLPKPGNFGKKATGWVRQEVTEIAGDKTWANWLENAPVSTNFDHARYELDLLSDFGPTEQEYAQLAAQPRNADGGYILRPGAYTMEARSFCLLAGTHGPSRGDGHLYAPLQGKSADFVQQILRRYGQNPEVSQQKVQVLLWAVIAGADMNTLAQEHQKTLSQLFTIGDLARFKAQHTAAGYVRKGVSNFSGAVRTQLAPVLEAESKMRDLVQRANVAYADFERIAMLPGAAPEADMVRQVSKGRWSYHPDGYFGRYFPNGYPRTRIDVLVPGETEDEVDETGRVMALNYPGLGRIEFEYARETYAAGSRDGFSQYIGLVTGLRVNDSLQMLAKPLELPFITLEQIPVAGSIDGQAGMDQAFAHVLALSQFSGPSAGRCPPPQPNPLVLSRLLTAIRWAYKFKKAYDISKCCEAENVYECLLANAATNWLQRKIKDYLLGKSGFSPQTATVEYNKSVVFDPSGSVAVPANRSSQRIGIAPVPVTPPPATEASLDWLSQIPPCPCQYDDAKGSTYYPEGMWLQCDEANQEFHYGATYEARWVPSTKWKPGQQCTYDQNKKLIGYGLAAGTADFRSPGACGLGKDNIRSVICASSAGNHWLKDVRNWDEMPCEEYMRLRPSSNELCLDKNPVNDWYFGQMCVFVHHFSCPEIRDVFQRFRDAGDVPAEMKQFMTQGKIETNGDAGAILDFLKKKQAEYGFSEPDWHRAFAWRVRDYIEEYQKTGKNPAACKSPFLENPPAPNGKD